MRSILWVITTFLLLSSTCEKEKEIMEIEYLFYGTSFGECIGYCEKEVLVSDGEAVFKKSGWNTEGSLPDSSCTIQFFVDPLPAYQEEFSIEEFNRLDEVIGCPDCADGGAEWLELSIEGEIRRVTFEYMNEPEELEEIITQMRALTYSFNGCQ